MKLSDTSEKQIAIEAIKKKLVGKELSYREIFAIMDEIANKNWGPTLTTYFAAAGFTSGFTDEELYYLTKAMVETGPRLHFTGIVADKHSIGGVAGTRTTMIVVPIIAAAGFQIPKTSSRAITSPAGTADTMEVVAPVTFTPKQIEGLVHKAGGCIVWGGHVGLAPADDIIIQVEKQIAFESFDKIIVSIMAKKVASGATHVVLDVPVGPTMKVHKRKDAELIADKFRLIAKRFDMKISVDVNQIFQNAGRGIGPVLEARDVFSVLEQQVDRPLELEAKAIRLAGKLLNLCYASTPGMERREGNKVARDLLSGGAALKKMREIIKAQGGNPYVTYHHLVPAHEKFEFPAPKKGTVKSIENHQITVLCRILGCPLDRKAGMYLNKKIDDRVDKGDILCTFYSSDKHKLKETRETLKHMPIYTLE